MARRRGLARLLVLATYRPVEVLTHVHPLPTVTQELRLHGQYVELRLDYLPEPEAATYLSQRFSGALLPEGLARILYQRTNGTPLFLVTLVNELVRRGTFREGAVSWELPEGPASVAAGVPATLRQLIGQQSRA
jgi:hypothetical protein